MKQENLTQAKVLILNGPNLNMLGVREPEIYGTQTLADIEDMCRQKAKDLGLEIDFRQSNHEGDLIDWIQQARGRFDALIINAAGYTHTSIAIHDALKTFTGTIIEVHLSDPQSREPFRHHSYIAPLAAVTIAGKGVRGYTEALEKLKKSH